MDILGRYCLAVVVAFAVSCAIFALMIPISDVLARLGVRELNVQLDLYIPLTIMGFCGVFFGSLCLRRPSRRFGSIALLTLGLIFYVGVVFSIPVGANDEHPYLWLWGLGALVLGGLAAVILIFRRSPSNMSIGSSDH